MPDWSDKEDARLREMLLQDGQSYRQIAVALAGEGFPLRTRNACIGRAKRLDIADKAPKRAPKVATLGPVREKNGKARSSTKLARKDPLSEREPWRRAFNMMPSFPLAERVAVLNPPPIEASKPIGIRELKDFTCHYPLWGDERLSEESMLYCGAPARTGPYCPHHHAIAYRRPDARAEAA